MALARLLTIARRIAASGGRALLVGGYVRDRLLGQEPKDLDVEVFGLPLERVEAILAESGEVISVGRSFGVLRVKGLDVDFSLPRLDSKVGHGHKGFEVRTDPSLDYAEAARRRDLTINSMAFDPLTEEILDPHGGRRDLEARVLRAVDATHFGEDPLRGVRVGQLAARFEMQPDAELRALCSALDLSELSGERIFEEMRKLLLKGRVPSLGLRVFEEVGYLRYFPELAALVGVPQDPEWHPEGDVWVHTCMVVDQAAKLRDGGPDDEALMFGALCHDLGKPSTTVTERGHVRSPTHDVAGVPIGRALLERWRASNELIARVGALTEHHLAPALFVKGAAGPHGYRKLARKLGEANVTLELLARLARADHLGRTTPEALAGDTALVEQFLARAHELTIVHEAPRDAVLGRHLIARGMKPGPRFGEILARCREVQDETGSTDPDQILALVLGTSSSEPASEG